jgi:hypothetical protein
MKHFLSLILCCLSLNFALGQSTDGYILFDVKYDDIGLSKEELAALPSQSEIWFKGNKMLMLMPSAMGFESRVVVDGDDVFVLMDMLGNKMAIKSSKQEMQEKNAAKPKQYSVKTITTDKKMIAGYECTKAIMSSEGEEDLTVWFTDKLKISGGWYYNMDGLKGFPLEFAMSANGMKMWMVAREINNDPVSSDKFVVPSGYKVMTQQELMMMFGNMK